MTRERVIFSAIFLICVTLLISSSPNFAKSLLATDPAVQDLKNNISRIYESLSVGDRFSSQTDKYHNFTVKYKNINASSTSALIKNTDVLDVDILNLLTKDILPWWEEPSLAVCRNDNLYNARDSTIENVLNYTKINITSHCGYRAWLQGKHQKVLSYSLFGSDPEYSRGLPFILEDTAKLYPGWLLRLYVDPRDKRDLLCPLLVKHATRFFVCDVRNLPGAIGDAAPTNPMLWRSAPMGDAQVDRFLVRDTDSKVQ